jgi:hypothetical protein
MQATADSSTESVRETGMARVLPRILRFERALPNKVINKWPAIKLAVSRTQSVIGRITFLVNSIITIKDIRATGVPAGSRCDNMWLVFFVHPNSIIPIQNDNDRGKVTVRCDVIENTCG